MTSWYSKDKVDPRSTIIFPAYYRCFRTSVEVVVFFLPVFPTCLPPPGVRPPLGSEAGGVCPALVPVG